MNDRLPPADFYQAQNLLSEAERKRVFELRDFLKRAVAPYANEWWNQAEFPHQLISKIAALDIAGLQYDECPGNKPSNLFWGLLTTEIARVDQSIRVFFGAHADLAMGGNQR